MSAQFPIPSFVRQQRKLAGLTQAQLAEIAGVGLRFVRDLEQGKATVQLDKVNQILRVFGHQVGPIPVVQGNEP